jgi:hypothetical protein
MNNYGTDITSSFGEVDKDIFYYLNNNLEGEDNVLLVKHIGKNNGKKDRIVNILRVVKDENGYRSLFNDDLGSQSREGVLG